MTSPMRINKYLAHAGITTRRGADTLIESGKVYVNGKKAVIGQQVSETDRIEVRDHNPKKHRYLLYFKPRGVITHSPEKDEVDILTRIQKDHGISGVFPVGRLDKDSEGLIILTDDGRITERLLSPESGHEKEYEVIVDKRVTGAFLNRLAHGVDIEGYRTKPAMTAPLPKNDHGFKITLTEGKKHQVRRMCAALGYQVKSLRRIRIMDLTLKQLKPGDFYGLKAPEAKRFLASLELN